MNLESKKILFADLDGTLIETISGKTFAEDCTDFRIRKDVLEKIKQMKGLKYICVITNQGGIPQYITQDDFEAKLFGIMGFIRRYFLTYNENISFYVRYCTSMDKDCPNRKPNTGMIDSIMNDELRFCSDELRDKSNMLMIGDASGKSGQFSDSDKKCAENFGIDYLDVDDFLKIEISNIFSLKTF